MFALDIFAFSLAVTCCSLPIPNTGSGKELETPKPRTINEAADQIDKYIVEKYSPDTSKRLIAEDIHKKWNIKAVEVETALETEMRINFTNMQNDLYYTKIKFTLRNEVDHQFDRLAPHWLRNIPMKRKYKWKVLLQMESEVTERLKFIITHKMKIPVDQFCEDLDSFVEQTSRNIHKDALPHLKSVDKTMSIIESLGFETGTVKKSLVALAFHFRNLNNTACFTAPDDYKFYFLYFPSLKTLTTVDEIAKFVNQYFDHRLVHRENITIIGNEREDTGARAPNYIRAFVRLNRTITNQAGKDVDVLPTLKEIEDEVTAQTKKKKVEAGEATPKFTALTSLKKFIVEKCGDNTAPRIFW